MGEGVIENASNRDLPHLNGVWLVPAMLTLRGFGAHRCLARSTDAWNTMAGHREGTHDIFAKQLVNEGVDSRVYDPKQELFPFRGSLIDSHLTFLIDTDSRRDPAKE